MKSKEKKSTHPRNRIIFITIIIILSISCLLLLYKPQTNRLPHENNQSDFFEYTAINRFLNGLGGLSCPKKTLVTDYSPRTDLTASVGDVIDISITVVPDAEPSCFFQKLSIPLKRMDVKSENNAVYTGSLTVPDEAQNGIYGAIEFVIRQGDYSEIITASILHHNAADSGSKLPEPKMNADGTYRMVELLEDAEAYDSSSKDNKNTALSQYPAGMMDYICGENSYTDSSGNKYKFLRLGNGNRICIWAKTKTGDRAIKLRYFDAKEKPKNTIRFDHTHVANLKTQIFLDMDWHVPMDVKLLPQMYFSGYQDRPYNIERFSATYIDICFSYSKLPSTVPSLEHSDLFYKAEWLTNKSDQPILRLYLKNDARFGGYELSYTSGGMLCLSFRSLHVIKKSASSYSLSGVRIAVDAGHGGTSSGATAKLNGNTVQEKIHTRKISDELIKLLKSMGATVLDVRPGDSRMNLYDRVKSSIAFDPDLFISIHLNDASGGSSGPEGYYYYPFSQPLASALYNSLIDSYPNAMGYTPERKKSRIRYYPFAVTRVTNFPSVLMEIGYMDSSLDLPGLCNPDSQKKLAKALADGIVNYLK